MNLRTLSLALALVLVAVPARAQYTRDAAAEKKIREAIDVHYLATDFDKAEGVLTAVVAACADKCSPQLLARAWMYVGIVRGGGKNDMAGAKEAFVKAKELFPGVKLDGELATTETQKLFAELGAPAPEAAEPQAPAEPAAPPPEEVTLNCTPTVLEIETRRPVPVECQIGSDDAALELRFKPSGEDWQSLPMKRAAQSFRAEIPCDKTAASGTLRLFVRAKDKSGDELTAWGSKANPIQIALVENSTQRPPSFADAEPPARCAAKEDCPPNFPGCSEKATEAAPTQRYPKNWAGLHVAQDLTFVGGTDICTQASQADDSFACYYGGSRSGAYVDEPYPGTDTSSGLVLATTRVLLSYDRALSAKWLAGVRVGYAFGGGPPAARDVAYDSEGRIVQVIDEGIAFLPYHLEARISRWFGSGVETAGMRFYLHAGGGLAQVDAKVETSVKDCGLYAPRGSPEYAACASGQIPASDPALREVKLDAWKKLGKVFGTVGGGAVYAFSEGLGLQLNVNAMLTLPATGFVLEPSLGLIAGF